jgi:hypothetical protein
MGDTMTDPQVADIARCLVTYGRCDVQVGTGNLQAVVDAGWAARKAGQLLGRPVRVITTRTGYPPDALVVTVTLLDS